MRRSNLDEPTGEVPVVEMTAEGDDSAPNGDGFEAFYRAHHEALERALILTIGDAETGRDAAAEGFARALLKWSRVGGLGNPPGWVYRTGLNWARSRWRRRRREVSPEEYGRLAVNDGMADETGRVLDDVVVTDMLARLSTEHRSVLVARFYLGWSEAEIAEALGVAPGTVKSRSARARAQLAERFAPDPSQEER